MTVSRKIANPGARGLVKGWDGEISAELVWDGTDEVRIPACMGTPRADQMQGTTAERLSELCGRICYDSLGKGRSSRDYHGHILAVGHFSTIEHFAFTVEITFATLGHAERALGWFVNRPGVRATRRADRIRVTTNPRAVREWLRHSAVDNGSRSAGLFLRESLRTSAPALVDALEFHESDMERAANYSGIEAVVEDEPENDDERWISLYVSGSRGFSHEIVRHGDWTAISQRSTRYVDESESDWVMHPLVEKFLREHPARPLGDRLHLSTEPHEMIHDGLAEVRRESARLYDGLVKLLEPWLVAKGVDKATARKQARGAARGVLGNALATEMIFSASVQQWRHMLNMRAADAADAEIRACFARAVLPELKRSRYGDRFSDLDVQPSSDGIGESLKGGGNR